MNLEIEAFMTTLDVTNQRLGWKPVVSAHNLTPKEFKEARVRADKSRLNWYFDRYFNLAGEEIEAAKEEGVFSAQVPSGQEMRAWCQNELPGFLVPL